MGESGQTDQDRGSVDDFHEVSNEFDSPSPINIDEYRDGEKETDDLEYDRGEGSFITGLYGETYLTSVDGTVYQVKEAGYYYFIKNSARDIFSIGDDGEMITLNKGGGEVFQKERITEKKIYQERNRDTDKY